MLMQYNGQQEPQIKTVFLYSVAGVTLKEGMAVAYDLDDTNAPVTGGTGTGVRGVRCLVPATAIITAYAGAITQAFAGKVIPANSGIFVDIYVPRKGDVVRLWTNISTTKNVTLLGVTNTGGHVHVLHVPPAITTADLPTALASQVFALQLVAVAMQTVDRSSTAGTVLARFV